MENIMKGYDVPLDCLSEIKVPAYDRKTNEMKEITLLYNQLYCFEKVNGEIFYGWIDTDVKSYIKAGKQVGVDPTETAVIFMDYEYVEGIGVIKKKIPLDIRSNDPTSIRFIKPARFICRQNNQYAQGKAIATIKIDGMDPFILRKGNAISVSTEEYLNLKCEIVSIQKKGLFKKQNILYVRELDDLKHPSDANIPIRMDDLKYISHLEVSLKII